jgi:predicted GNAT family acetyltransferase
MELTHRDDGREGVFVLKDGAATAGEVSYAWADAGRIVIEHTGVRRQYEGRGLGKRLVYTVVEFARQKGIRITPRCPFARALFERSDSFDDVRSA